MNHSVSNKKPLRIMSVSMSVRVCVCVWGERRRIEGRKKDSLEGSAVGDRGGEVKRKDTKVTYSKPSHEKHVILSEVSSSNNPYFP